MAHESVVHNPLRAGGKDSMFIKVHKSATHKYSHELLWLPDASCIAEDEEHIAGTVAKKHPLCIEICQD